MTSNDQKKSRSLEHFLHGLFIIVVYLFYSFDRNNPLIELSELAFFLNYLAAAFIINYVLFPKFIYKKKYISFAFYFALLLFLVIIIEELVIEQIFFKDTRGKTFANIIFTLMDILPPIIILSGFKIAWDAVERQKELDELKLIVQESELKFLKSQINPHFLFNNLNNLYVLAVEKSDEAPDIILALSSILRYMLYECQATYVSLNKEIEQLHNFVHLGELQIEGRGKISVTKDISQNTLEIAPLLLIVFIENAFKHSTSSQTEGIEIEIDMRIDNEDTLYFTCKNSFQEESNLDNLTQGIGLENVRKRLELLYPKAYRLDISATENFFNVELELKLKQS